MLKIKLRIYRSGPSLPLRRENCPGVFLQGHPRLTKAMGQSLIVLIAIYFVGGVLSSSHYQQICLKSASSLAVGDKGSKPFSTPIFQCTNQSPNQGKVIPTPARGMSLHGMGWDGMGRHWAAMQVRLRTSRQRSFFGNVIVFSLPAISALLVFLPHCKIR